MNPRRTRTFAVVAAAGMFLVLLMGATVTTTGSGEGCGQSWPLCHGRLLPGGYFESMMEYSHRFVTGIEGIFIALTAYGAWRLRRRHREFLVLVPLMVGTLLFQSGLGAWAVKSPQSPLVMASHFGVSLVALASIYLVARVLFEVNRGGPPVRAAAPTGFRWLMWGALGVSVIVAYLGAYVRHTGSELACTSWPGCATGGAVYPGVTGAVGIHFNHRLSAIVITLMLVGMLVWANRLRESRPDLYTISVWAVVLVILQSMVGALVVLTEVTYISTITHAGLMAALFVILCDGCRSLLPLSWRLPVQDAPAAMPSGARAGASAGD